jgi:prepilin-type N-terminal cleavage/methylation domain-containing protein
LLLSITSASNPRSIRKSALTAGSGFSLVELLVVIAIVAILAIGGSMMISSRRSGAVRSLLDELEGAIASAHQSAVATGRDTALVCRGIWEGNTGNPFFLAYGDAELTEADSGGPENFIKIAEGILNGDPDTRGLSVSVAFNFREFKNSAQTRPDDSIQMRARVVVSGDDGWERATGTKNERISNVAPFITTMKNALSDENNFCLGNDISILLIHGSTKRFTRTAFIKVVATNSSGNAVADAPMGLLVMLENSASVFKFYNPGADGGDGKWRRI